MSHRRLALLAALAGGVVLLAGAVWLLWPQADLVVLDVKTNRVLLRQAARPGDRFVLSYLHSVSKSRVTGTFEISPEYTLAVKETAFGSFGPGLPLLQSGDDFEAGAGIIRLKVDQRIDSLLIRVHPFTEHELEIGGRRLELSKTVPAGGGVLIEVRR